MRFLIVLDGLLLAGDAGFQRVQRTLRFPDFLVTAGLRAGGRALTKTAKRRLHVAGFFIFQDDEAVLVLVPLGEHLLVGGDADGRGFSLLRPRGTADSRDGLYGGQGLPLGVRETYAGLLRNSRGECLRVGNRLGGGLGGGPFQGGLRRDDPVFTPA